MLWLVIDVYAVIASSAPLCEQTSTPFVYFTVIYFMTSSSSLHTVLFFPWHFLHSFGPHCHNFLGQSSPFFVHPSPVRHVLSSFARIIAIVVVSVISFIIKVSVLEMETLWRWCLEVNKDFKLTRLLC